ncbi:MAG TPA: ester cyclase [Cellvibrio sp.]|nr:ester cyclase [Cellvibrio sp.]
MLSQGHSTVCSAHYSPALPHQNELLVREFLQGAHSGQIKNLDFYVAEQVKCWGFPEFNPANRDEYQGFFNYMTDVFAGQKFSITQLLADDTQVLVRFCLSGAHHEEFMGLPASGGDLEFIATALFRLEQRKIREVWMYNKQLQLQTRKGYRYLNCPPLSQMRVRS